MRNPQNIWIGKGKNKVKHEYIQKIQFIYVTCSDWKRFAGFCAQILQEENRHTSGEGDPYQEMYVQPSS